MFKLFLKIFKTSKNIIPSQKKDFDQADIVAVGEKSGALDESFLNLADFYSKEVSDKTKKIPTVIEPILLLIIGVLVLMIALSIILPIYQLTRGIK